MGALSTNHETRAYTGIALERINRESATLQDFPLEYAFMGIQGQVHQQIGNAVPVRLAKANAEQENVLGLPPYVGAGEILAQLPPATLKP